MFEEWGFIDVVILLDKAIPAMHQQFQQGSLVICDRMERHRDSDATMQTAQIAGRVTEEEGRPGRGPRQYTGRQVEEASTGGEGDHVGKEEGEVGALLDEQRLIGGWAGG